MNDLYAKILQTISKYNMTSPGKRIIAAVSGGADSVCLLYVLLELKEKFSLTIEACHVNHMLRGENSDNDEQFVIELCKRLQVPLHIRKIDVKKLQKKHQSLEECAREARYSCFCDIGTNALVATAHNADDNAETVLLNLIRGTALKGLCGIPPIRNNIIRPLIEVSKAEILDYLAEKNAEFVTDESNFSDEFTRNDLRNNIIPLLQKINPSLSDGITRMCKTLRLDDEYLREITDISLKNAETSGLKHGSYKTDVILNLHPAVRNRIISAILSKNNISPSNLRINGVVSILENGGKINLMKNKFAVVKRDLLYIEDIVQKNPQKYRK